MPLKTTTQKTQMIFRVLVPNLKQLFLSQIKISSDHSNISNPDTKTIIQTPCLSLASENNCETPTIVAIDAFIDELIEGKETVVAAEVRQKIVSE